MGKLSHSQTALHGGPIKNVLEYSSWQPGQLYICANVYTHVLYIHTSGGGEERGCWHCLGSVCSSRCQLAINYFLLVGFQTASPGGRRAHSWHQSANSIYFATVRFCQNIHERRNEYDWLRQTTATQNVDKR